MVAKLLGILLGLCLLVLAVACGTAATTTPQATSAPKPTLGIQTVTVEPVPTVVLVPTPMSTRPADTVQVPPTASAQPTSIVAPTPEPTSTLIPTATPTRVPRATTTPAPTNTHIPPNTPTVAAKPTTTPISTEAKWFTQFGVNLAGAEFGEIPGSVDKNYIYPGCKEIGQWVNRGIKLFRYPVRYERLLRDKQLSEDAIRIGQVLNCAAEKKAGLILDLHNYGRLKQNGKERVMTDAELSKFWSLMAQKFGGHPGLAGYGLMNEAHDMEGTWPEMVQAAIDAIRAIDKQTTILIGGDCWSGAQTWVNKDCNNDLATLKDPENNLVYEAHQYYDPDNTGTYACGAATQCGARPGLAKDRLNPFLSWCEARQVQCFIGEMGVPADEGWQTVLQEALTLLKQKNVGVTLWAAGPWWDPNYPLSLERPEAGWILDMMKQHQQ